LWQNLVLGELPTLQTALPTGIRTDVVVTHRNGVKLRREIHQQRSSAAKLLIVLVPRVGVEPTRPYGQRILSPFEVASPSLIKRYEPVFTSLAVVKVSLRLVTYQHVRPPSWPHLESNKNSNNEMDGDHCWCENCLPGFSLRITGAALATNRTRWVDARELADGIEKSFGNYLRIIQN